MTRKPFGILLLFASVTTLILQSADATAEPYLAVRTGFKCSQCHVNQTGGGKRTDFGVNYSQTHLYMKLLQSEGEPVMFDPKLNRSVSVGANFRAENVSLFEFENIFTEENDFDNSSRIVEANFYMQFDLVPDALSVYLDQTMAENSANREFFALIQNLPLSSYLKLGRMLLPYGLRMRDDEAFIRNGTNYTYNSHDLGAEVGFEPGPYSLVANVTQNKMSIVGSTVYRRLRVGGSFATNLRGADAQTFGVFGGANVGRFTLLGEVDVIQQDETPDRLAVLGELNYLITRGFNLKVTYEFFDRNRDVPNARDGQERFTFGIEPFITQFMQVGVYYRMNRFVPQNVRLNRDQLLLQFHAFF